MSGYQKDQTMIMSLELSAPSPFSGKEDLFLSELTGSVTLDKYFIMGLHLFPINGSVTGVISDHRHENA
jgi:hypothetical protein